MLLCNLMAWVLADVPWVQYFHGQLTGSSLLVIGYMLFYAKVHKYCLYSWACIAGLGSLNILNLIHFFIRFKEIYTYSGIILIGTTILTFALIKWKQSYFKS